MVLFIAIFGAVALFAASALVIVLVVGERSATETRLAELQTYGADVAKVPFRYRVEDLLNSLTSPLAPFRDWLRSRDEELAYRLSRAGFRRPEDAETFLSLKLLAPVLGVLLATFAGQNFFLFALLLGAGAYFAPDALLFYAIGKRTAKIGRALPDTMDLLVICMEAGLGIDQAVLRISKELEGVYPDLSEELLIISHEQRAGKPRLDAWRSMSDRVDLEAIRQFVAMLVQTDRLGTPIAQALSQFADALRTKRMLMAEEQAAKTTVKLVFPLLFFIFPAMFVVLLGPAIIAIMKGFEQQ
jgi:tight adherence protein C